MEGEKKLIKINREQIKVHKLVSLKSLMQENLKIQNQINENNWKGYRML
jgi:hypothetical protein